MNEKTSENYTIGGTYYLLSDFFRSSYSHTFMKGEALIMSGEEEKLSALKFDISLKVNINIFKELFGKDRTVVIREFENKFNPNIKYCAISIAGMIDKEQVNENIIAPLINANYNSISFMEKVTSKNIMDLITAKVVNSISLQRSSSLEDTVIKLLSGDTVILIDGVKEALLISADKWTIRAVDEPESERSIRGPRDGFTENITVNLSLIRRRIISPDLKLEISELGSKTRTKICICYMEGIANPKILEELRQRLKKIDLDGVLYPQTIEEYIKDCPLSIFKTIGSTERPDVAASRLLEGRIVLVCDGNPFALTLPYILIEYFQAPDDYANNYIFASFNRLLRYLAFFIGLSVPALYTAMITFHQELVPTPLLLSINNARLGVPFPTVIEATIMLIGFELLREAGVRLPKPVGQAVSIVGALVIGEAAVTARLISSVMVVMVAVTSISSFLVPKMIGPFIILRLGLLFLSGFIGFYGYIFGIMGLFIYLMSMRSFGVPYTYGVGLIRAEELKDTAVRAPWWYMKYRPKLITKNSVRKDNSNKNNER